MIARAVLSALFLLSAVLCQFHDEDYVDVSCQYQWGGTICECENSNLMRLPALHGNIRQIHVKNCDTLYVPVDSLSDLREIIALKFENIAELDFRENSLKSERNRPAIRLEIINSTVKNLPSHLISGHLEDLLIVSSNISKIHAFAFTGFFSDITTIRINNSIIGEIEAQAFRKLTARNLEILDSTFQFNSVSRTFYDCHIQNVIIQGSKFSLLNPSTFDLKEVQRLRIFNTTFGVIEGEAFMMDVSDRAIFSNNTVSMLNYGAFQGITMNSRTPTTRTQEVYFEFKNNHINFIHPEQDITFCPNMKLQVNKLFIRDPRSCEALGRIHENKFFSDNSNSIFMRIQEGDEEFESISYLNDRCRTDSNWFLILMIIIACVVLLVIIFVAICCYFRNRKHLDIIMPEPRTYRQTQIVMQIESHGLMKTDF